MSVKLKRTKAEEILPTSEENNIEQDTTKEGEKNMNPLLLNECNANLTECDTAIEKGVNNNVTAATEIKTTSVLKLRAVVATLTLGESKKLERNPINSAETVANAFPKHIFLFPTPDDERKRLFKTPFGWIPITTTSLTIPHEEIRSNIATQLLKSLEGKTLAHKEIVLQELAEAWLPWLTQKTQSEEAVARKIQSEYRLSPEMKTVSEKEIHKKSKVENSLRSKRPSEKGNIAKDQIYKDKTVEKIVPTNNLQSVAEKKVNNIKSKFKHGLTLPFKKIVNAVKIGTGAKIRASLSDEAQGITKKCTPERDSEYDNKIESNFIRIKVAALDFASVIIQPPEIVQNTNGEITANEFEKPVSYDRIVQLKEADKISDENDNKISIATEKQQTERSNHNNIVSSNSCTISKNIQNHKTTLDNKLTIHESKSNLVYDEIKYLLQCRRSFVDSNDSLTENIYTRELGAATSNTESYQGEIDPQNKNCECCFQVTPMQISKKSVKIGTSLSMHSLLPHMSSNCLYDTLLFPTRECPRSSFSSPLRVSRKGSSYSLDKGDCKGPTQSNHSQLNEEEPIKDTEHHEKDCNKIVTTSNCDVSTRYTNAACMSCFCKSQLNKTQWNDNNIFVYRVEEKKNKSKKKQKVKDDSVLFLNNSDSIKPTQDLIKMVNQIISNKKKPEQKKSDMYVLIPEEENTEYDSLEDSRVHLTDYEDFPEKRAVDDIEESEEDIIKPRKAFQSYSSAKAMRRKEGTRGGTVTSPEAYEMSCKSDGIRVYPSKHPKMSMHEERNRNVADLLAQQYESAGTLSDVYSQAAIPRQRKTYDQLCDIAQDMLCSKPKQKPGNKEYRENRERKKNRRQQEMKTRLTYSPTDSIEEQYVNYQSGYGKNNNVRDNRQGKGYMSKSNPIPMGGNFGNKIQKDNAKGERMRNVSERIYDKAKEHKNLYERPTETRTCVQPNRNRCSDGFSAPKKKNPCPDEDDTEKRTRQVKLLCPRDVQPCAEQSEVLVRKRGYRPVPREAQGANAARKNPQIKAYYCGDANKEFYDDSMGVDKCSINPTTTNVTDNVKKCVRIKNEATTRKKDFATSLSSLSTNRGSHSIVKKRCVCRKKPTRRPTYASVCTCPDEPNEVINMGTNTNSTKFSPLVSTMEEKCCRKQANNFPGLKVVKKCCKERTYSPHVPKMDEKCSPASKMEEKCINVPKLEDKCSPVPKIKEKCTTVPKTEDKCTPVPKIKEKCTSIPKTEDKCPPVPKIEEKCTSVPKMYKKCTPVPNIEEKCTPVPKMYTKCSPMQDKQDIGTAPISEFYPDLVPGTDSNNCLTTLQNENEGDDEDDVNTERIGESGAARKLGGDCPPQGKRRGARKRRQDSGNVQEACDCPRINTFSNQKKRPINLEPILEKLQCELNNRGIPARVLLKHGYYHNGSIRLIES